MSESNRIIGARSIDEAREKYKALNYHIRQHTGGVWQELPGRRDPRNGSSTCLRIADRLFLATAAHNFQDLLEPNHKVTLYSSRRRSTTSLTTIAANYSEYGAPDTLDVAWVEIDLESAARADIEGLPLRCIEAYHTFNFDAHPPEDYNVVGMPMQLATFEEEGGVRHYTVSPIVYFTTRSQRARPDDEELQLDYAQTSFRDGAIVPMPHPGGISGGGVWHIPPEGSGVIWSPANHRLVGIVLWYKDQTQRIGAARMHQWLELVLGDNPELKDEIEPCLNPPPQTS